jgi:hypothetical protein
MTPALHAMDDIVAVDSVFVADEPVAAPADEAPAAMPFDEDPARITESAGEIANDVEPSANEMSVPSRAAALASDPLEPVMALSADEKIALFT